MDSQASKHVDWCVKKAEKEIEESRKQKKKVQHRGLRKIEPNRKRAIGHLEKAAHNLEVFNLLRKNNSSDWSITAGFYTLYHCFLAIAVKFGYESRNQTCTIMLMEMLKEQGRISIGDEIIGFMKYEEDKKTHEDSLIELREDYTYGIDLEVKDEDQLNKIENLCVKFIDIAKDIVY